MTRTARGIKKGEPLRFLHGHNIHGWRGPAHPQWIDGRAASVEARRVSNIEHGKRNYRKYRDRKLAVSKAWRVANPDKIRARDLAGFGITIADYDTLLAAQGGVCAICKQPETRTVAGKLTRLAVDHEHGTDRIRGLLCWFCNTGIGLFRENPEIMQAAMEYLEGTRNRRGVRKHDDH